MVYEQYRKTAVDMIMAGVRAADPTEAVTRNVRVDGDTITICDRTFSRTELDRILVFSVGKAATPMASAFESVASVSPNGSSNSDRATARRSIVGSREIMVSFLRCPAIVEVDPLPAGWKDLARASGRGRCIHPSLRRPGRRAHGACQRLARATHKEPSCKH